MKVVSVRIDMFIYQYWSYTHEVAGLDTYFEQLPYVGYLLGGPPHPVIVTMKGNDDCARALLYYCFATITGWGVHLRHQVETFTALALSIAYGIF